MKRALPDPDGRSLRGSRNVGDQVAASRGLCRRLIRLYFTSNLGPDPKSAIAIGGLAPPPPTAPIPALVLPDLSLTGDRSAVLGAVALAPVARDADDEGSAALSAVDHPPICLPILHALSEVGPPRVEERYRRHPVAPRSVLLLDRWQHPWLELSLGPRTFCGADRTEPELRGPTA